MAQATGEMKRSLTLTGITVNAMALIAPGAFLWTTFQLQAAQTVGKNTTAESMWVGLLFALVLAFLTAYSYSELARIYPDAGAGSSYYFAEAALLDKDKPQHRKYARLAKLSVGWISHLYYWVYPGIMVAFTATLAGYLYQLTTGNPLNPWIQACLAIPFALLCGYIAFRGVSGSTNTAIVINVIQIVTLVGFGVLAIVYRLTHASTVHFTNSAAHIVIPHQFSSLLFQSTIAILLLVGFESVTALGAEALRPERDIRRGILLSLAIQGGICYLFEYFAANLAVGPSTITYDAAAKSSAPIGDMLTKIGDALFGRGVGTTLTFIMALTVLLALIGTTLACLNTGVRVTYVMAKDKEMPSILGLLHGKNLTPHGGVWILTAVSAVLGFVGAKSIFWLSTITYWSNVGTFIVYGMSCLIAIVAFSQRHDKHWLKHYFIPGLGAFMNVAMLVAVVGLGIIAGGDGTKEVFIALGLVIAWIVAGIVWVAVNPQKREHKLIHDPGKRQSPPELESVEALPIA